MALMPRAGLTASKDWPYFDDAGLALPGDIAIQDGIHDGTADNPY